MTDIVERLRARQVTNWMHATGQTPRASGKRTDPLCAAAADEIERLRAEVAGLRECAIDLWMMLDDIDTGGDRTKADDVLYRAIAERTHRRRFSPKYQVVIDAIDAALAARKGEA